MKFDLERAFCAVLLAVVLATLLIAGGLLVWLAASTPAFGLVLTALALVFIIGGFWPRK